MQMSPLPLHPPPFSSVTNPTIASSFLSPAGQFPFLPGTGLALCIVPIEDGTGFPCMFVFPVITTRFPSSMVGRNDPSQEINHVSHVVADEDGGFQGTSKGERTQVEKGNTTQSKGEWFVGGKVPSKGTNPGSDGTRPEKEASAISSIASWNDPAMTRGTRDDSNRCRRGRGIPFRGGPSGISVSNVRNCPRERCTTNPRDPNPPSHPRRHMQHIPKHLWCAPVRFLRIRPFRLAYSRGVRIPGRAPNPPHVPNPAEDRRLLSRSFPLPAVVLVGPCCLHPVLEETQGPFANALVRAA